MTIGFIAYLLVVAGISVVAFRRTDSARDYVIGGRSLSAPVAALSAGASDMSGWLLLGLPGAVFVAGLGEAWIVVGLVAGAWGSWRLVAPRLRLYTEHLGEAVTLPQFFSRRVAARTPLPGVLATLLVLFFFAVYVAASFVAGAKLLEATLGLSYTSALWSGVALVLAYTAVGGFLAVSWTDFFQALLMLGALVVVAGLAFAGAPAALPDAALDPGVGPLALVSALAWGLGYFGQPHFLARFLAIDGVRSVPLARRINLAWMTVAGAAAVAVGLAGQGWFPGDALADPETVFIALAGETLAPWLAGIVVAGILAAVMSTVDSQLLVASTALVEDVLRPLARTPERLTLPISRVAVGVIALAAGLVAMDPTSAVMALVSFGWGGLAACFGPAMLACLYWRNTSETGLVAGMLVGGVVTVVWRQQGGGLFDLYEIVPAFALAGLAIVLFSRGGERATTVFDRLERLSRGRSASD